MDNDEHSVKLKQGLDALHEAFESLAKKSPEPKPIPKRSLTGDHILGGKIHEFESTGIKDTSQKLSLVVTDKGITTKFVKAEALVGDNIVKGSLTVEGNATVAGELTVKKLHVDELVSDTRIERSSPLEFHPDKTGIYGKGIYWKGDGATKQFIYRANPDRIWSTETIDLSAEAFYSIDNVAVLGKGELGSSVRKSYLTEVGTLQNLKTQGDLSIDEYIYYSSAAQRLGFGTESPNASVSIVSLDSEFIVDVEGPVTRIGNWTTDDLEIVTDDTARISISRTGNIVLGSSGDSKVSVAGKLGVNIKNPDVDISTAGAVRFQGKKFEVDSKTPENSAYRKGDVVWNDDPKPTGYVGWICVRDGTPGEWKPFGQISV
jgi:hypothetical protein